MVLSSDQTYRKPYRLNSGCPNIQQVCYILIFIKDIFFLAHILYLRRGNLEVALVEVESNSNLRNNRLWC